MSQLIIQRAKLISDLTCKLLMEDEVDDIQIEAYRFSLLVLRGTKSFRQLFQAGKLYLDKEKIHDAYCEWRFEVPGTRDLFREEASIIDYNNQMVRQL